MENIKIPAEFDFSKVSSLSMEARQKMNKIKPSTIAQASRISGVSPADINVLLVYLGRWCFENVSRETQYSKY